MELNVLYGLEDLQYPLDADSLKQSVDEWPVSLQYSKLVEYLTKELQHFCKLEEHVNSLTSSEDSKSFLLELSSFLKELGCPYKQLIESSVEDRLKSSNDRYLLLDFLITELITERIVSVKKPSANHIQLTLNESETGAGMRKMLMALSFPKPPTNITPKMLFDKVISKVKELSDKCVAEPLFSGMLSTKQWSILTELVEQLNQEYKIRRQMLLKRLDVTIQSFQWSERMRNKENEMGKKYTEKRVTMSSEPGVRLSDLIATRSHLAILEKTSNANVRKNTKSSINEVIIGRVPDRGGRPQDQQPPPPEMPSWAPRATQPQGFGGGSARGGGGGGGARGGRGRVQGGWNSGSNSGYQGGNSGYKGGNSGYQGGNSGYQGGNSSYQGGNSGYQGGDSGYQGGNSGHENGGRGYQGGGRSGRGGRGRDRY